MAEVFTLFMPTAALAGGIVGAACNRIPRKVFMYSCGIGIGTCIVVPLLYGLVNSIRPMNNPNDMWLLIGASVLFVFFSSAMIFYSAINRFRGISKGTA